jgi:WD40 repeat protein
MATRQPIGPALTGAAYSIDLLAFSPDGKTLATAGDTVRLWNMATRQPIGPALTGAAFTAPGGGRGPAAFSPDSKTLAAAEQGDTVRLWNMATRQPIGDPLSVGPGSSSMAFSPDGKTLAIDRGPSGTQALYDVATSQPVGDPLTADIGGVGSVAFSPDGKTLAIGSVDGVVWVWDVSYLANVSQRVCALAGRSFTRSDWSRYVPPGPAYQQVCP